MYDIFFYYIFFPMTGVMAVQWWAEMAHLWQQIHWFYRASVSRKEALSRISRAWNQTRDHIPRQQGWRWWNKESNQKNWTRFCKCLMFLFRQPLHIWLFIEKVTHLPFICVCCPLLCLDDLTWAVSTGFVLQFPNLNTKASKFFLPITSLCSFNGIG